MGDIIKFPLPAIEATFDGVVVLRAAEHQFAGVENFDQHHCVARIAISDSFSKLDTLLEHIDGIVCRLPEGAPRQGLEDERRRLAVELGNLRADAAPL